MKNKLRELRKNQKLTQEELTQIQGMLNDFNQMKMKLGDAELTKQTIIRKIDKLQEAYIKLENELSDKYGKDSRINVQTGEIEDIPKEEKSKAPLEVLEK
jgi:transcriptional regulator with XRE-family HTH domain